MKDMNDPQSIQMIKTLKNWPLIKTMQIKTQWEVIVYLSDRQKFAIQMLSLCKSTVK